LLLRAFPVACLPCNRLLVSLLNLLAFTCFFACSDFSLQSSTFWYSFPDQRVCLTWQAYGCFFISWLGEFALRCLGYTWFMLSMVLHPLPLFANVRRLLWTARSTPLNQSTVLWNDPTSNSLPRLFGSVGGMQMTLFINNNLYSC